MGSSVVREELLALVAEDSAVRAELAADGSLFEGYHPRMEAVHVRNARRLEEMLDADGWPGVSLAGEDGAEAAFLIAQHAISLPAFQRRALVLLSEAARRGDVPPWQAAYLTDRIRLHEGRPQLYGTQFDWDEGGLMSPMPIEDPEHVDERRRAARLDSLADRTAHLRADAARSGEKPPGDAARRRLEMEAWARRVGWRE